MSASNIRPPQVIPLELFHDRRAADTLVLRPSFEPSVELAPVGRPHDAIVTIVITVGMIRVELHEAEQLVLDTNIAIEQRLPPTVLAVRSRAKVEPLRMFGREWGRRLHGRVWVRGHGTAQLPVITIGGPAEGTWTLEEHECRLWWTSGIRACTLRMSVDRTGTQLVLRPGCCEP